MCPATQTFAPDGRTCCVRLRALTVAVALTSALAALLGPVEPASADVVWPHFLKIHVEARRDDTRILVDTHWAGVRWVSQPGVRPGDYLVRVDQNGFVRSLDAKLTFWRQAAPPGSGLRVHVQSPGVDGYDTFVIDYGSRPGRIATESHAGPPGNVVTDVFPPYRVMVNLPMEFEIYVGSQCRPNQFLQVALEWTNTVWRTPDGTAPGLYRVRVNPDFSVQSLDGKVAFAQIPAKPADHGHQVLGVLIVHSCDQQGDGADIVGWDRDPTTGQLAHMTTWDQRLDAGYGWQIFDTATTFPRESFAGGNWIVHTDALPAAAPPLNLAPDRLDAASKPAVSVAASVAHWAAQSARTVVLARFDQFADALAGIPLALAKGGPLLLCSPGGVEEEVVKEIQRVLPKGGTVYLLGGQQALSGAVEATIREFGFTPRRVAGPDRMSTAVGVADEIGPAANAFIVNAWNFPDALSAGSAAGAASGGAHILLTNPDAVPGPTAAKLSGGGYQRRFVFGGPVVVHDATAAGLRANERIAGADRDGTSAAAANRFFPKPAAAWVADGGDFVGGIAGGAMAAKLGGPLLLATGKIAEPVRTYLAGRTVRTAYVMAALDEGLSRLLFTQPSH
jgi:putative cell wall-binding protein